MIRKFYAIAIMLASGSYSYAQTDTTTATEKKPFFKFSGSADVYFKYDFRKNPANTYTSFTNTHNSFELGMLSAKVEHQGDKVSFVGDLGFGSRADQFAYNDVNSQIMLKQLFITYAPAEWVKFSMGSWTTHIGYELVDPYLNRNYSMSYMFSYGPFFHTGLKADLVFDRVGVMVGVVDPTDFKTAMLQEGTKYKTFIGQLSYGSSSGNFKGYFNALAGKRGTDSAMVSQFDVVLTQKINNSFSLGANGTVANFDYKDSFTQTGKKSWWGAALYVNYDAPKVWGVTLRSEYYDDKDQSNVFASAAAGGHVWANTVTLNLKVSSLMIMPEIRYESASEEIYSDLNGEGFKNNTSFLLSAVYQF
ncbi:porin [Solitalea longa]|uniref:Porin n=1 Tax=Solitalea longa TaxID=2079460 RepID=A0A2S4ZWN8_9SPHI|nr:outer membrane beta-barrel protein [Solitalea longa]POY34778.1 porin [Solitalea longa]